MISHDKKIEKSRSMPSKEILGVYAHLSKCWRGAWSEKGWEPMYKQSVLHETTTLHIPEEVLGIRRQYENNWANISRICWQYCNNILKL